MAATATRVLTATPAASGSTGTLNQASFTPTAAVLTASPSKGSSTPAAAGLTASPSQGSSLGKARFDQVGLTNQWSESITPDPKAFVTNFKAADAEIDAVIKIAGGTGWITASWKYEGALIKVDNVQGDSGTWTHLGLSHGDQGGFPGGNYEVVLTIPGSSESKSIEFQIDSPTASGKAKFEQAGIVAKWDSNASPDPNSFLTNVRPSDTGVGAAVKLTSAADGWVTASWKYQGQAMDVDPIVWSIPVQGGQWGYLDLAAGVANVPVGTYEVSLNIASTSEAKSLKFTVGSSTPTAATIGTVALTNTWDPKALPDAKSFATTFKSSDSKIYAVYEFSSGSDGWVRSSWTYQGALIAEVMSPLDAEHWFEMDLYRTSSQFTTGDYEVKLAVIGTSETKSLKFSVEDATASASTPSPTGAGKTVTPQPADSAPTNNTKFDQTGMLANWDPTKAIDPNAFTRTFSPTAGEIDVLFTLTAAGEVTSTWKYQGKLIPVSGQSSVEVTGGQWGSLYLIWATGVFPTGDYEVILGIKGSPETKAITFTVR